MELRASAKKFNGLSGPKATVKLGNESSPTRLSVPKFLFWVRIFCSKFRQNKREVSKQDQTFTHILLRGCCSAQCDRRTRTESIK